MKRRQKNTVFIFCVIGLFICSSIVPAFSIDFRNKITDIVEDNVESFIERKVNETGYLENIGYCKGGIDSELGYDDRRSEQKEECGERFCKYYLDYTHLMDHSHYLFDEDYEVYRKYPEKMMAEYADGFPLKLDNSPSEPTLKPDFKNGTTWYVDDDGGGDFTKIQNAIDSEKVKDGDTLYVYSGRYYENVVVNKSIILEGEDRDNTVIDGCGTGTVVSVEVDWVKITDFKITNSVGKWWIGVGIYLNSNKNIINDNNLTNNRHGVVLSYSSGNNISDNIISDNSNDGIILVHSSGNNISGNLITGNDYGIYLRYSSGNNNISSNIISKNNYTGIWFDWTGNNDVIDNIFVDNNISNNNGAGIQLFSSSNSTISGNTIVGNDYFGLELFSSSSNVIIDNKIRETDRGNNNIVNHNWNIISDGYGTGIQIWWSSDNNTVIENTITDNKEEGIYLEGSLDNIIKSNIISNNKHTGIQLFYHSSSNRINENKICENLIGILLSYHCSNNSIIRNYCNKNQLDGISILHDSLENNIQFNKCDQNVNGIAIVKSSENLLQDNIFKCNHRGIFLGELNNTNLLRNYCFNNAKCGIELRKTSQIQIGKCLISKNGVCGIYCPNSDNLSIFKNDFITNNDKIKNDHYHGWYGYKNFFFRNYWSGRKTNLPVPYLVQFNSKLYDDSFPHQRFTFNWDWFPKATPYNYEYDTDWNNT